MTVFTASSINRDAEATATRGGVRATYAAFMGAGVVAASWASRIPQIRSSLHLNPAQLGLVLLSIAVGSLIALPLAGVIVHHLTSRRTVAAMAVLLGVGLAIACIGYHAGVGFVVAGFFLLGFANGAWDVAMNVQGAIVERRLGRAIMPRFHAGYSVGTVVGALVGVAMIALHVPVTVHLSAAAIATAALVPFAVRGFVPDADFVADADPNTGADTHTDTGTHAGTGTDDRPAPTAAADGPASARSRLLRRWLEPRTLLIGLFVLAFGFAEGTGNDWINIALIDGYHVPAAVGTLGFATFLVAMTTGRWFGPAVLDRYGRVAVLRGLAVIAITGLIVFVYSPVAPLAFLGAALWGIGASLGFPVGMSAASDDPAAAAGRVSVVASIAYCSFLGGPPLIGFLGAHFTVLRSLIVVAGLVAVSAAVAGVLRPPPLDPPTPGGA